MTKAPITSPFFNTPADVSGTRPSGTGTRTIKGTVRTCVVDDGESDLADAVTQHTVKLRTFFIRRFEWIDATPPQAGDVFTMESGDRFAAEKVSELQILGWNVACRQV